MEKLGGKVSYKTNPDGTASPYELNINYYDALAEPESNPRNEDMQIEKFICAHAIMFSLKGVPGIYFHSLFGSIGWPEGVKETGRKRTINRQKLRYEEIQSELKNKKSRRARIFSQLSELLIIRKVNHAFDPKSRQSIMDLDERLFSLIRFQDDLMKAFICIHNLSPDYVDSSIKISDLISDGLKKVSVRFGKEMVLLTEDKLELTISPYSVIWAELSKLS
jgi:sucrose phosphorylase